MKYVYPGWGKLLTVTIFIATTFLVFAGFLYVPSRDEAIPFDQGGKKVVW